MNSRVELTLDQKNYSFFNTVSTLMQPHSWIEPNSFQILMQPQCKIAFKTIQAHLEYMPTLNYQKQN